MQALHNGFHDLSVAAHSSWGFPQDSFSTCALILPCLIVLSTHFKNLTPLHKENDFSRAIFRDYLPPPDKMEYS